MTIKTLAITSLLLLTAGAVASALDIQWQDGRLWTDVDVTDMNSFSVTLFRGTSSTTMLITDLPPEAQQKVRTAWAEVRKRRAAAAAAEAAVHPAPSTPPPNAGADIALQNGDVYHHARIVSVDAATASIQHSAGITRVRLEDLPDDLRAKVAPGYSPERASAFLTQEANAQREAAEEQANVDQHNARQAALDEKVLPS